MTGSGCRLGFLLELALLFSESCEQMVETKSFCTRDFLVRVRPGSRLLRFLVREEVIALDLLHILVGAIAPVGRAS